MGITTIQEGKIKGKFYKIAQLDDKYTVYLKDEENQNSEYYAVASFDNLQEAKTYLDSLNK